MSSLSSLSFLGYHNCWWSSETWFIRWLTISVVFSALFLPFSLSHWGWRLRSAWPAFSNSRGKEGVGIWQWSPNCSLCWHLSRRAMPCSCCFRLLALVRMKPPLHASGHPSCYLFCGVLQILTCLKPQLLPGSLILFSLGLQFPRTAPALWQSSSECLAQFSSLFAFP